jgi:hypothetical protein
MPDYLPHQDLLETLLVDQVSATADVLIQKVARDLLREPEGKMQPEYQIHKNNPENRGTWLE